jgi:hypothetical protein
MSRPVSAAHTSSRSQNVTSGHLGSNLVLQGTVYPKLGLAAPHFARRRPQALGDNGAC